VKTSKILFLVFLILLTLSAVSAQPVWPPSSGTIYIRSDGSVYPSTASIQRVGDVYTFTNDIIGYTIEVERDNIVIDGAGHTLQGAFRGIYLSNRSGVTIKNMKIKTELSQYGYAFGIVLTSSYGNTIVNNEIIVPYNPTEEVSLTTGIFLEKSSNNNIISNNMITSIKDIGIQLSNSVYNTVINNKFNGCGISAYASVQNTVTNNTVDDKPIVYLDNVSDYVVENAGQIILVNSNNITVSNFVLPIIGIQLLNTKNSLITKNEADISLYESSQNVITENTGEIKLRYSEYNNISKNTWWIELSNSSHSLVSENRGGIKVTYSTNITMMGNQIDHYITIQNTINCEINSNNITGNGDGEGIVLSFSHNNSIVNNIIANHTFGVYLRYSSNNIIYGNNFVNNTAHVVNWGSVNIWDNGTVGNYWNDYADKYPNATRLNGIWNTPYEIPDPSYLNASSRDNYPLTNPVDIEVIPEFPSWSPMLLILIVFTVAVTIYKRRLLKTPIQ
jgi:parallel beta-helix repeat protein